MNDSRPKAFVKQLLSIRRLVETVTGNSLNGFISKTSARDLWHLSNRFIRKLLAHTDTVGVFLNHCFGQNLLAFEALVQI